MPEAIFLRAGPRYVFVSRKRQFSADDLDTHVHRILCFM